ncbi:MAG: hypothetical protein A2Y92_01035 [Chloroflexi bacterium RBG_13_57_8]|nr:MAG: hypothetical protein A2Y92_01035 [Chloroflexi bacterium RBG_13_57_8]
MAISNKYGKIDIPDIGDNEPVFILRAQDILAEPAITLYRLLTAPHGNTLASSLDRDIENFRNWEGIKKIPD